MDGEDIEARAAVHDATRVTVHYLDAFHAVLFPPCSPQLPYAVSCIPCGSTTGLSPVRLERSKKQQVPHRSEG